jgi:hypothetical protein
MIDLKDKAVFLATFVILSILFVGLTKIVILLRGSFILTTLIR